MEALIEHRLEEWPTFERQAYKSLFGWRIRETPVFLTKHLVLVSVTLTEAEKVQAQKPHIYNIVLETEPFDLSPLDHEIDITHDKYLQAILINQKRWLATLKVEWTVADYLTPFSHVFNTYPQANHYSAELKKTLQRLKHYLNPQQQVEKIRL